MGADIIQAEVLRLEHNEKFTAFTKEREYIADTIILATGAPRKALDIRGMLKFEGSGVSYCAICDGFFFSGQEVAVLGCCENALNEINLLTPVTKGVTLLTNGETLQVEVPEGVPVITKKIAALEGTDRLQSVLFEDGTSLDIAGLFVALGAVGNVDLAKNLGAQTALNRVIVNDNMETTVSGLFAAGDITGGMHQITEAAAEGYRAGMSSIRYLRSKPRTQNGE